MSPRKFIYDDLKSRIGKKIGVSDWYLVDQEMVDRFAEVTNDPDPMHIDPEWCRDHSPYRKTVSFGFLTMSLLTHLYHMVENYDRLGHAGNIGYPLSYGFNSLRLTFPVPVGSRVRGHFAVKDVEQRGEGKVVQTLQVEIEVEGEDKPALVGEWLGMWVIGDGHKHIKQSYTERPRLNGGS